MKTRWIRLPFLIPLRAVAQVIFPRTVFYTGEANIRDVSIALAHIHQIRRYGLLSYWFAYVWQTISGGYRRNAVEIDAIARAPDYMAEARLVLWSMVQKEKKWILTVVV